MAVQIQFRRDTGANWASANTVLAAGEMGINTQPINLKLVMAQLRGTLFHMLQLAVQLLN